MTLATIPFFLKVLPDETEQKGTIDVTGRSLLSVGVVLFTLFTTNEHWMYLAGCLARSSYWPCVSSGPQIHLSNRIYL